MSMASSGDRINGLRLDCALSVSLSAGKPGPSSSLQDCNPAHTATAGNASANRKCLHGLNVSFFMSIAFNMLYCYLHAAWKFCTLAPFRKVNNRFLFLQININTFRLHFNFRGFLTLESLYLNRNAEKTAGKIFLEIWKRCVKFAGR